MCATRGAHAICTDCAYRRQPYLTGKKKDMRNVARSGICAMTRGAVSDPASRLRNGWRSGIVNEKWVTDEENLRSTATGHCIPGRMMCSLNPAVHLCPHQDGRGVPSSVAKQAVSSRPVQHDGAETREMKASMQTCHTMGMHTFRCSSSTRASLARGCLPFALLREHCRTL